MIGFARLSTFVLVATLTWMPGLSAAERRPCVNKDSPPGCVSLPNAKPMGGLASVPDPDSPKVVPLDETPIGKALKAPDEFVPPDDFNKPTVTVTPVPPDQQGAPNASSKSPPPR